MNITLSYSDTSLNIESLTKTLIINEVFYNNLKQADNSMRFSAVFTVELSNFLKTHINDDVKCVATDNGATVFTGYVRKNITFEKTQINQPIALEIVSPSFLLNKTINKGKGYINKTLAEIVTGLLESAGFSAIGDLSLLSYAPPVVVVPVDSNYKEVITELLYEYGFIWDFDKSGAFTVHQLFNLPETSTINKIFNGTNCKESIHINAKELENDHVAATYDKVEHLDNALIFSDTSNASGAYKCVQPIESHKYFADKQYNYLDCDSTAGKVVYIESVTPQVNKDSTDITFTYSKTDLANDGSDLGTQICFSAYNGGGAVHNLTQIDFYGAVFVSNTVIDNKTTGTKGKAEITLKYICEDSKAEEFTTNYTNWMRYANNNITLKSATDYNIGDFVKVTDNGIGTYYGRIIQKSRNYSEVNFNYVIETFTEFEAATVTAKQTQTQNILGTVEAARENLKAYTDEQITAAQLEASPRYDVQFNASIIKKTSDNAYSPAIITASARKIIGDTEEQAYSGRYHVYINNSDSEYGSTVAGSSLSLNVADIASYVNEITQIKIVFKSASDGIVIDQEVIPVLSNAAAYSIVLDNDYNAFMCDDSGKVNEETITIQPHVYYGLAELPYGADGWSFMPLPSKEGFTITADYSTGAITIKSIAGSVLDDRGNIGISLFIHSSVDEELHIGYISGTNEEIYIGYENSGASYEVGYTEPAEDGIYTAYFSYSKMSELGLLLKKETDTSSPNYGDFTVNGAKITVGSIDADKIRANSITVGQLHNGAVTSDILDTGAVTSSKLDTGAVTTDKIDGGAVTNAKLDNNSVDYNNICADAVRATQIKDGEIKTDHLDARAVTAAKIDVDNLMSQDLTVKNILKSPGMTFETTETKGFYFDKNGNTRINNLKADNGTFNGTIEAKNLIIYCNSGNKQLAKNVPQWSLHPTDNLYNRTKKLYLPVRGSLHLKFGYNIYLTGSAEATYFDFTVFGWKKTNGNEQYKTIWAREVTTIGQTTAEYNEVDINCGGDDGYYMLGLIVSFYCNKASTNIDWIFEAKSDDTNYILLNALLQWQDN